MQRCLAGRIAAADQIDFLAAAQHRFAGTGAVVDTGSKEPVLIRQPQFTVIDASSANRGTSDDLGAVIEVANALAGDNFAPNTGSGDQQFMSELLMFAGTLQTKLSPPAALRLAKICELNLYDSHKFPWPLASI